jgi:hypothetical protein
VVAPAVCYVIIDGASHHGDYEPAQYFMQWYGEYGAGEYMRPDSIARAFQYIASHPSVRCGIVSTHRDVQSHNR